MKYVESTGSGKASRRPVFSSNSLLKEKCRGMKEFVRRYCRKRKYTFSKLSCVEGSRCDVRIKKLLHYLCILEMPFLAPSS
jgi:hypothetical protein